MESADQTSAIAPEPSEAPRPRSRIGRVLAGSCELVRIVYRNPEHFAERLTLYAADRYGGASREWAQSARSSRPDTPRAVIAEQLRTHSAQVARIAGAIAGTFFIALVPGYLTYLLPETRMTLRTAALYDRVLPVTFMIVMAWGCETHTRQLGRRALVFYDGEDGSVRAAIAAGDERRDQGHDKRSFLRAIALSIVIATAVISSRRQGSQHFR